MRTAGARELAAVGRRRSHPAGDHASHRRRWLVHRGIHPRTGGPLPGRHARAAIAAARTADSVCRLRPLAAAVAAGRGVGDTTRLLAAAVAGYSGGAGPTH